jgi:hypothetical protein
MKTALITPIPDLDRFAGGEPIHMMLAQLCSLKGSSQRYLEFYARERANGSHVILDNGADELGKGINMSTLLDIVEAVRAQEVILPDVQGNGPDTVAATQDALRWLVDDGREQYIRAGEPKLMIVPQGQLFSEWRNSLNMMLNATEGFLPVIGVAKNHDELIVGGLGRCLRAIPSGYEVHLLGWPRRLITLLEVAEEFPWLRSVDSGRPFKHGMIGQHLQDERRLPTRAPASGGEQHFFEDSIPTNYENVTRSNVDLFKAYAGA